MRNKVPRGEQAEGRVFLGKLPALGPGSGSAFSSCGQSLW